MYAKYLTTADGEYIKVDMDDVKTNFNMETHISLPIMVVSKDFKAKTS